MVANLDYVTIATTYFRKAIFKFIMGYKGIVKPRWEHALKVVLSNTSIKTNTYILKNTLVFYHSNQFSFSIYFSLKNNTTLVFSYLVEHWLDCLWIITIKHKCAAFSCHRALKMLKNAIFSNVRKIQNSAFFTSL
jgi:hypothetical protein